MLIVVLLPGTGILPLVFHFNQSSSWLLSASPIREGFKMYRPSTMLELGRGRRDPVRLFLSSLCAVALVGLYGCGSGDDLQIVSNISGAL